MGCGAGGLVWQAVPEGRANADPSAFADEVILPTFSYPLQPYTLGSGGEWSALDEK